MARARPGKFCEAFAKRCAAVPAQFGQIVSVKTILAPIDFSSISEAVIAEAVELASIIDARVVLLAVIQPPAAVADYAPVLQNIAEITAVGERTTARRLAKLRARLEAASIPVETARLVGSPGDQILAEARRRDADYIVMGSHGHTALYDLIVGSTTHAVLKRAPCPVIVIPASRPVNHSRPGKKMQHTT